MIGIFPYWVSILHPFKTYSLHLSKMFGFALQYLFRTYGRQPPQMFGFLFSLCLELMVSSTGGRGYHILLSLEPLDDVLQSIRPAAVGEGPGRADVDLSLPEQRLEQVLNRRVQHLVILGRNKERKS